MKEFIFNKLKACNFTKSQQLKSLLHLARSGSACFSHNFIFFDVTKQHVEKNGFFKDVKHH